MSPVVEVSAGLVFRDGRLLVARRPEGTHLAGLWEFPGGKREEGETFEECLLRELREELGVLVKVGPLVESVRHAYPGKSLRIDFFSCRLVDGEPVPIEGQALRWVTAGELGGFVFPEADRRLIGRLSLEPELWNPCI